MIKHIVFWKIKENAEGLDGAAIRTELRKRLEALPALIPEIKAFQVGDNFSTRNTAMDMALVSEFENREDLQRYQDHPRHREVADFVKAVTEEGRVVDYAFEEGTA